MAGKDLTLNIDLNLQALGERLLEGKIGSIVAIEPSTGEVLAMVSSPTYDPRIMVGRSRGKSHRMLQHDLWKPLLNRSIMGLYPPGSTFKTSQALTFLSEGIVTPGTASPVIAASIIAVCMWAATRILRLSPWSTRLAPRATATSAGASII